MSLNVTVVTQRNSLFIEAHPGMNLFFKLINLLFSYFKLETGFHNIPKAAEMVVVFCICKPITEQERCQVHEPKAPAFCGNIALIYCNVRDAPNKSQRDVLDCIYGFVSNLCPHLFSNFILPRTNIKALEFPHPQLYQGRNDVFEKKMHPVPWITLHQINR